MTIGLVSEPKSYSRKLLINRFLGIKISDNIINSANPFQIQAEILPFSNKRLENMSAVRLNRLINKKVRNLEKSGITNFILSDCLYRLCQAKNVALHRFSNGCGKNLFLALSPLCIRQTAKKQNINLLRSSICISDTKMDRISEYLLRELCFDTKTLIFCTSNTKSAEAFCESFYDETGLWVDVRRTVASAADITIDIDKCEVKIGRDLFIRDAILGFDFFGYSVRQCDAASLLKNPDLTHIRWVYNYTKLEQS